MIAYKFVKWDIPALDTLKNERVYILAQKAERKEKLTRAEKDEIFSLVYPDGARLHGWHFPFFGALRKFYVEQYGNVFTVWAPDKMSIRNKLYGHIANIVDAQATISR